MSWDTNVYYHPEKWDLTQIGHLEDPDASYSFDDLIVWQHVDGGLYWATDSGCSCPTPFEEYDSLSSLEALTSETWNDFAAAVEGHCWPDWNWRRSDGQADPLAADKTELLAKVARLIREAS